MKTATPELTSTAADAATAASTEPGEADATPTKEAAPTETEEPTEEPTPEQAEAYLGDFVNGGGIELAAYQVEDPTEPGSFYEKGEGMRLVAVEVELANVAIDPFTVNALDFVLQDEDGFTYQPELGGRDGGQISLVTLEPGERVRGWIAFELPEAAALRAVRYNPLFSFSDISLQTNLAPRPDGAAPLLSTSRELPDLPNLGDVVEQGGYSLSAITVDDPSAAGSFVDVPDGHRIVAVEIVLGNISGAELSVNALSAFLVDTNGYVYGVELGGSAKGQIDVGDLQIGDRMKGWVAFIIPGDAVPEALKYEANMVTELFLRTGLSEP